MLRLDPVVVFFVQRLAVSVGLACWLTYANVRRIVALEFGPLELVAVGAVLSGVLFLFEIPSGVAADVWGRRRAIVAGFASIGLGFGIEAVSTALPGVLVAQAFFGAGWSMISGSRAAWLADEIGETRAVPLYLRAAQLGHAATVLGIGLAAALVQQSLVLPLWIGSAALLATAAFVALCMTEEGFRPSPVPASQAFAAMGRTLRGGLLEARNHAPARILLGTELCIGAGGEIFDRLWQLQVLEAGPLPELGGLKTLTWFAGVDAVAYLLAIPALEWARRRAGRGARLPTLLVAWQALSTVAAIGFALAGSFSLLVAAWCVFVIAHRTVNPLGTAWVNQRLDSRVRATVLSLIGQGRALGEALGSPVGGVLGRALGVSAGLLGGAAFTLPAVALFGRAWRRRL